MRYIYLMAIGLSLFCLTVLGGCGGCNSGLVDDSATTTTLAGGGGDSSTTTSSVTTTTSSSEAAPVAAVRLMFIHHSCGENWLKTSGGGGLGAALNNNNYYVTEAYYGWSAESGDGLGDDTDTTDWSTWFTDAKMPYVYSNSSHYSYTNNIADPGGENESIMFKSCFPNSEVGDSIADEKAIYNGLKTYFNAHPDKLFILITPPGEQVVSSYVLTKELCDWLADTQNGWLSGYTKNNVAVFDFYCVLSETDSHHRIVNGVATHEYSNAYDGTSPYHDSDDHPNAGGNIKARNEFIPILNTAYNRFKGN